MTTRKRGGQPGNDNAVKHGFYGRFFTDLEAADLGAVVSMDLEGEISMLRVALRRVFDQVQQASDIDSACFALSTLGTASTRLAGLIKVQRMLQGAGSVDVAAALSTALGEVIKEFGCGS